MEKAILQAGFRSVTDFFLKAVLPVSAGTIIVFFAVLLFFPLPFYFAYGLLILGFAVIFAIPYILFERSKVSINENIHVFITYAGTISTIDINRKSFFGKIAGNEDYGHISMMFEKILYFAKSWNLGFSNSCRRIRTYSPSRIFSDFLDRFAAALDFGEPLDVFMIDEQKAIHDDYSTMYKESLENINMLKEAFIAITISVAFGMSTALLLPLLMGISIVVAVKWSLLILFLIDMMLLVFVIAFIPSDNLCHNLKIKDKGTKKIYLSFMITLPVCIGIAFVLFYYNWLSFLFNFAISVTPLLVVGFFAVQEENTIFKRDKEYPAFIRSLGATIFARQGGVLSSIEALQVHEFGVLQDIVTNLYKRLKVGSDKLKSWAYFSGESGSKLISRFTNIFADSIYLGGHARKIGEIISENFQKLLSLRKLRYQQASGLKGSLYGAMIGFVTTVYISVAITQLLTSMFSTAWSENVANSGVSGMIASIIPPMPEVDVVLVGIYIGLTIILHAFVSALVIKIVDGGNKFAMLFDFIAMVWLGTITSWLVPILASKLFAGQMGA